MRLIIFFLLTFFGFSILQAQPGITRLYEPVSFSKVTITDDFWRPRQQQIATTTLDACIYQTEVKTPRIRNFEKVARGKGEPHEGIYYDDSDVYKALEAIAYSLRNYPDAELEAQADAWISKIAAAQLPDGYLNTYYTLNGLEGRWTDMEKHEAYCAGHLMEAAVAYYHTTGKRQLLDVAIRLADHIDSTFRQTGRPWVTGHQEIELALVKLYRVTGNDCYLKLADWFLAQRGHGHGKGKIWDDWKSPEYCQDAVPVKAQTEITGHAVRAMYLYTGAADVGSLTGDAGYWRAMETVWEDVVGRNMYLTGGIGSSGRNEGFTIDYDLPNEQAYCETCASVGMVFWQQRMHLLTGDARFIDVLERSLYNGALSGLALSGDRFFYGNPLASEGQHGRREWFGTACCPSNISRLAASVGDYVYGASPDALWVNLYIGSSSKIQIGERTVGIETTTNYPWDGQVKIKLQPDRKADFALRLRLPGWARGEATPGGLYHFTDSTAVAWTVTVNGKAADYRLDKGYIVLQRSWKAGDEVVLHLPMPVRQVEARSEVTANAGRAALQRGPLVYCVESVDNGGEAWNILLPTTTDYQVRRRPELLNGVTTIDFTAKVLTPADNGQTIRTENRTVTAIPYYAWCNRGSGGMQVWLPRRVTGLRVK